MFTLGSGGGHTELELKQRRIAFLLIKASTAPAHPIFACVPRPWQSSVGLKLCCRISHPVVISANDGWAELVKWVSQQRRSIPHFNILSMWLAPVNQCNLPDLVDFTRLGE